MLSNCLGTREPCSFIFWRDHARAHLRCASCVPQTQRLLLLPAPHPLAAEPTASSPASRNTATSADQVTYFCRIPAPDPTTWFLLLQVPFSYSYCNGYPTSIAFLPLQVSSSCVSMMATPIVGHARITDNCSKCVEACFQAARNLQRQHLQVAFAHISSLQDCADEPYRLLGTLVPGTQQ
eukprot:364298-Chlamydomonas_euryale.AAC.17